VYWALIHAFKRPLREGARAGEQRLQGLEAPVTDNSRNGVPMVPRKYSEQLIHPFLRVREPHIIERKPLRQPAIAGCDKRTCRAKGMENNFRLVNYIVKRMLFT
jgi:hypothetical protein